MSCNVPSLCAPPKSVLVAVPGAPGATGATGPAGNDRVFSMNMPLLTAGSDADIGYIAGLPSKWAIIDITVLADNADAGALSTTELDIRTQPGNAGYSVLTSPIQLSELLYTDSCQTVDRSSFKPFAFSAQTTLYVRQTIDSLNAGSIRIILTLIAIP